MTSIRFALNHMTAPSLAIDDFFALARSLGIDAVEIRNDLSGNAILDGTKPEPLRPGEPWGYTRIFLGQEPAR